MFDDFTYDQRLLFCKAMANIIASDHKVTPEEETELEGLILSAGLTSTDERVATEIQAELKSPSSLPELLKGLGSKELQSALFRILVEAACADGEIAPQEHAKILEAASTFGLDKTAASDLVGWTLDSLKLERRESEILARLG